MTQYATLVCPNVSTRFYVNLLFCVRWQFELNLPLFIVILLLFNLVFLNVVRPLLISFKCTNIFRYNNRCVFLPNFYVIGQKLPIDKCGKCPLYHSQYVCSISKLFEIKHLLISFNFPDCLSNFINVIRNTRTVSKKICCFTCSLLNDISQSIDHLHIYWILLFPCNQCLTPLIRSLKNYKRRVKN